MDILVRIHFVCPKTGREYPRSQSRSRGWGYTPSILGIFEFGVWILRGYEKNGPISRKLLHLLLSKWSASLSPFPGSNCHPQALNLCNFWLGISLHLGSASPTCADRSWSRQIWEATFRGWYTLPEAISLHPLKIMEVLRWIMSPFRAQPTIFWGGTLAVSFREGIFQ